MFRKKVKCRNCGFLALQGETPSILKDLTLENIRLVKELELWDDQECTQLGRDAIAEGTHAEPFMFTCTRHVWDSYSFKSKPMDVILQFINSKRECPYYFQYNPGYSPIEHRELQQEARTRRLLLIGMLSAAVIGAVAALVGQLIAR